MNDDQIFIDLLIVCVLNSFLPPIKNLFRFKQKQKKRSANTRLVVSKTVVRWKFYDSNLLNLQGQIVVYDF